MRRRSFLVTGVYLSNKGSELMLRSLVGELRSRFGNPRIALSSSLRWSERVADLALADLETPLPHVAETKRFAVAFGGRRVWRLLPRGGGEVVRWGDVEALFDISGFLCSDDWGVRPSENLRSLCRAVASRGAKVFLMPQAFGPFSGRRIREAVRGIVDAATLAFARDEESYEHLVGVCGPQAKIRRAPDITLGSFAEEVAPRPYACIVPNERMLDQGRGLWKESYTARLAALVRLLLSESELEVRVVIHDAGGGDERVWSQVASRLDESDRVRMIREQDPTELKRQLAASTLVLGSRFHALASALSCSVPALALGWSHKYEGLFRSYGASHLCYLNPGGEIEDGLRGLLDAEERQRLRTRLLERNRQVRGELEALWDAVSKSLS